LIPTESAGVQAVQIGDETLVGRLGARGLLRIAGEPDAAAEARQDAARWLRALWHKAGHETRVVGRYDTPGGGGSWAEPELTEAEISNRGALQDVAREIGPDRYRRLLAACVDDKPPRSMFILLADLRALAVHRRIWPF
jgi:hypothetical protein